MSQASSEDSESGNEEHNEGSDNESVPSRSRSPSPAHSSSDKEEGPLSPSSPPDSPSSVLSQPVRSRSGSRSPSPRSQSPSSDRQSVGAQDIEGNASDEEEVTKNASQPDSDNEEKSSEVGEDENQDESRGSGKECSHSEAEDSDREEIPEVNIDSGDENEEDKLSEKGHVSEEEMEQSDVEEKDDDKEKKMDSDAGGSDDESTAIDESRKNASSPIGDTPSSPVQEDAAKNDESDSEQVDEKKIESDAEDNVDSDSDAESAGSEVGGLIADIFGDSDDDEEFEGFKDEELQSKTKESPLKVSKEKKKRAKIMSDSEDENEEKVENEEQEPVVEDVATPADDENAEVPNEDAKKKAVSDDSDDEVDRSIKEDFVSDFDLMMLKKKEEHSKKRKRKDVDLISDSDDLIADIITQMRIAADEDKHLNKQKMTATKKLKILPMVMSQLKKQDLKMAFLDQGVLNVIADWLTPLPDRSLPHLNIREGMIKQLGDLPSFDQSLLKSSGVGKALMYLYRHPKETKENKERAGKIIREWSRPIFNVTTDYHALTKEEREQRDYDHVPQKRRKDGDDATEEEDSRPKKDIEKELSGEKTSIRPGDKGWIGRARVPMPSTKDYVNRPKWNKEMEFGRGPSKKPLSRLERHMRSLADKKKLSKQQRAITISIEGRKMAI